MAYLGKVQLNGGPVMTLGSMLYGISNNSPNSESKRVDMPSFDALDHGITIHVRFMQDNTNNEYITLTINDNIGPLPVLNPNGKLLWKANSVISFTYDQDGDGEGHGAWIMNSSGISLTQQDITNAVGTLKLMTFKGTVGTNGTVITLPNNAAAGDTYKTCEAYTVESQHSSTNATLSAKEGDLLIATLDDHDVLKWVLIPAGDDFDLFIEKGTNNSNKFLKGNSNWVELQSDPITELVNGDLRINVTVPVDAKP